jgi:hypothetical protein
MSKAAFSTNDKLNKSIDRAQKRREIVNAAIAAKMQEYDAAHPTSQPSDKFAYMTGYMNSLLGSIAQAETVAEMRRVFNYSGIKI